MDNNLQSKFYTELQDTNKFQKLKYNIKDVFAQAHNTGYQQTIVNIINYLINLRTQINNNKSKILINSQVSQYNKNYNKYYKNYIVILDDAIKNLTEYKTYFNKNLSVSQIQNISHKCNSITFYNNLSNQMILLENNFNNYNDDHFLNIIQEYENIKSNYQVINTKNIEKINKIIKDAINEMNLLKPRYLSIQEEEKKFDKIKYIEEKLNILYEKSKSILPLSLKNNNLQEYINMRQEIINLDALYKKSAILNNIQALKTEVDNFIKRIQISNLKNSIENKSDLYNLIDQNIPYLKLKYLIEYGTYTSTYIQELNNYENLYNQYTQEINKINYLYSSTNLNNKIRNKTNLQLLTQIKNLPNVDYYKLDYFPQISQYLINTNTYITAIDKKLGKKLNINGKGLFNNKFGIILILSMLCIIVIILIVDLFINFISLSKFKKLIIFIINFYIIFLLSLFINKS